MSISLKNLQDAHAKMCERILEILEKEDPTVQELKLVAQFLKDNRIEALPVEGSPMGAVVTAVKDNNIIQLPSFPSGELLDEDDPEVCGIG